MAAKVTDAQNIPADTKWEELDFTWLQREMFSDYRGQGAGGNISQSLSCCGVLELGSIRIGRFDKLTVRSVEKLPTQLSHNWLDPYPTQKPKYTRYATEEEISEAFEIVMSEQSKQYGLGTAYLRNSQQCGDFRKLLEKNGWTYQGQFWNPKTRHSLHHWTKVFHKTDSKRKKKQGLLGGQDAEIQG